MKRQHWALQLFKLGACNEAVRHCLKYKTPRAAWAAFSVEQGEAEGWVLWLTKELTGDYVSLAFERVVGCHPMFDPASGSNLDLRPYVPVPTLEDIRRRIKGDFPWILEES